MASAIKLGRRQCLLGLVGLAGPALATPRPLVPLLVAEQANMAFVTPLLKLVADGGGFDWKITQVPWPRLMTMLTDGESMAWGVSRTPERERILDYSDQVFARHVWLVVPAGQPQASPGLEGIKWRTLCKRRGFTLDEPLNGMIGREFQVVEADLGYDAVLRMMLAGRCDGTLFTHRTADAAIVEQRLAVLAPPADRFVVQRPPLNEGGIYFAVAKKRPVLAGHLRLVNVGLRAMAREIKTVVDSDL